MTAGRAQVENILPASQYQGRIIILAALMEVPILQKYYRGITVDFR